HEDVQEFLQLLRVIRTFRSQLDLPPKESIGVMTAHSIRTFSSFQSIYERLARVNFMNNTDATQELSAISQLTEYGEIELLVPQTYLNGRIDRMLQRCHQLTEQMAPVALKLSDESFCARAPEHVVSEHKERLESLQKEHAMLMQSLNQFQSASDKKS
ncbi:MAG: hypothetical protein FJ161_02135, partial [Gammaproteobacteria bacterium]|nr:hypothetical protein [Gammaproteobacteria bacterium]